MSEQTLFPEPPPVLALAEFHGHQVRVVGSPEAPQWVAADVCRVLNLSDVSMALRGLETDEKGTSIVCTPGGWQNMLTVYEAGLYALAFRSRRPEAKAFRRWVLHEVLPTIRRHGCYPAPAMTPAMLSTWATSMICAGPARPLLATIAPRADLMPLSAVPTIQWLPRRPSVETVYEWHRYGRRGVYLETLRASGRLFTTECAVFLFLSRLAAPNPRPDAPLCLTVAGADHSSLSVLARPRVTGSDHHDGPERGEDAIREVSEDAGSER